MEVKGEVVKCMGESHGERLDPIGAVRPTDLVYRALLGEGDSMGSMARMNSSQFARALKI